jgi:hypothetical protein
MVRTRTACLKCDIFSIPSQRFHFYMVAGAFIPFSNVNYCLNSTWSIKACFSQVEHYLGIFHLHLRLRTNYKQQATIYKWSR